MPGSKQHNRLCTQPFPWEAKLKKHEGLHKLHPEDITDWKKTHLFQAQTTTLHINSNQQHTNHAKRLHLNTRQKKTVINDMTFVSTLQPSEYAFQYAELQLIEEHSVTQIEVLNTKKQ